MLWSILIAGIPERYHTVHKLLHSLLETQAVARMPDVELLYFVDNKRRPVGAKRNDLMSIARGEYISFIDDDDEVAIDYVSKIYREIVKTRKNPLPRMLTGTMSFRITHKGPKDFKIETIRPADVICFPQRCTLKPAGIIHECTYSIKHKEQKIEKTDVAGIFKWTGPPAHTMVWHRELVKDIRFPDKMLGEDVEWVGAVCKLAKTEVQIEGTFLYHYQFDEGRSATR